MNGSELLEALAWELQKTLPERFSVFLLPDALAVREGGRVPLTGYLLRWEAEFFGSPSPREVAGILLSGDRSPEELSERILLQLRDPDDVWERHLDDGIEMGGRAEEGEFWFMLRPLNSHFSIQKKVGNATVITGMDFSPLMVLARPHYLEWVMERYALLTAVAEYAREQLFWKRVLLKMVVVPLPLGVGEEPVFQVWPGGGLIRGLARSPSALLGELLEEISYP